MKGIIVKKIDPVHRDDRGIIVDLLNESIEHVGIITSKKGAVRGNHYHKTSKQYTYIFSGSFEVLLRPFDNLEQKETLILKTGDLIEITPGIVHTFTAIEDSTLIEMDTLSRALEGYEKDVVRLSN